MMVRHNLYAVVRDIDTGQSGYIHVYSLTGEEFRNLGPHGCEKLAEEKAKKHDYEHLGHMVV